MYRQELKGVSSGIRECRQSIQYQGKRKRINVEKKTKEKRPVVLILCNLCIYAKYLKCILVGSEEEKKGWQTNGSYANNFVIFLSGKNET